MEKSLGHICRLEKLSSKKHVTAPKKKNRDQNTIDI